MILNRKQTVGLTQWRQFKINCESLHITVPSFVENHWKYDKNKTIRQLFDDAVDKAMRLIIDDI